jgi:DNA-binding LytR/AlgR family response regulator
MPCARAFAGRRSLVARCARSRGRAIACKPADCRWTRSRATSAQLAAPEPQKPLALLEGFCPEPPADEQIAVHSNGRLLLLRISDIDRLEAKGGVVTLHVGGQRLLLRETLTTIAAKLPRGRFVRIGRSALVRAG